MLTQEQIAAAQKANLETFFGLTNKAFEGVEKRVELNLQVVKATLAENVEHSKKALSAKDAQELLAVHTAAVQPLAEKVLADRPETRASARAAADRTHPASP